MRFLDTNILVYAALNQDPVKHRLAALLLKDALLNNDGVISAQVINEFANTLFKKTRRTPREIQELISRFMPLNRMDMTTALVNEAIEIKTRYELQYYDALIVAAAKRCGCDTLLTEDLNDGQTYDGVLCRDPFKKHHKPSP